MAGDNTSLGDLAGRYAAALLDLADERKALDEVAGDLQQLRSLIAESADLRRLLTSPIYSRAQQSKAVAAILDKAGLGELTRRFVLVVASNSRLFALSAMIEGYLTELARRRGEITAEVTSARNLSDGQQAALLNALRSTVGDKVQLDLTVDPALIGGLIVKVGSRMVDSSLRSKLQRLQLAMKGVG
ncbi:F0F1 ATP synthase subunit delta [Pelagibius litoralis]|uniref:ATP synthase subunit delta n=1 Tax=Pelagibius litoralis TaxID=374515 RepID=A0A967C4K4_9PROT|nr:F0F1 ATP synthase subunit delta [Pelagibius litoralis]NIA68280.1 F0F1 ATP synthase subunit delta [Pelagibius litoralis]